MLDAAHAAHLLAAAGAAGAAVDQDRQRRAVAGRFGGVGAVDDQHPAVIGGGALDELARGFGRMGEERQRQAAHAAIGERDGVGEVAVGHDRRDRPERPRQSWTAVVPHGSSVRSRIGSRKAPPADRREASGSPDDDPRAGCHQLGDLAAHVVALAAADERAHPRVLVARVADLGRLQAFAERVLDRVEILGRRHGAADRGAFLPRLDRHLGHDFLDEQVELRRARRGVGAEQRGVEAVLLGDEAHRFALDDRMRCAASARSRPSR